MSRQQDMWFKMFIQGINKFISGQDINRITFRSSIFQGDDEFVSCRDGDCVLIDVNHAYFKMLRDNFATIFERIIGLENYTKWTTLLEPARKDILSVKRLTKVVSDEK